MYNVIENLINHKFYKTSEEIVRKLVMFNSYKVLTDEEFMKLMDLVNSMYAPTERKDDIRPIEVIQPIVNKDSNVEENKTEINQ